MKRHRLNLPRWKPVRARNPVAVAIVGLLLMGAVLGLAFKSDDLPLIGGGTYYSAYFTESAGLHAGNEVRVAGVKVGKITGAALDHGKVKVTFRVKDTWIGDASTGLINIKTVLGDKYLAIDPQGAAEQDPHTTIPLERTRSPYDVTEAFQDFSATIGQLDTEQLATNLDTLSATFAHTAPSVRAALDGLAAVSKTISSRDAKLARLLAATKQVTGTIAGQNAAFEALLKNGNVLLDEVRRRRDAIHGLLIGTQKLAQQLSGLVDDNKEQLSPTLKALGKVTDVLLNNQANMDRALKLAGPYTRLLGNALGNGRWMDGYLCGLIPKEYLPAGTGPATGCRPPKQGGE